MESPRGKTRLGIAKVSFGETNANGYLEANGCVSGIYANGFRGAETLRTKEPSRKITE